METDTVKAKADRKPRSLNNGYRSIALTENEVGRTLRCSDNWVPTHLEFETKRPQAFLPLGSKFRFRNLFANYGWTIRAWTPVMCGRAKIVCSFPEKIYGSKSWRKAATAKLLGAL